MKPRGVLVRLRYTIGGTAKSKACHDAPSALNDAVRLVQAYNGDISKLDIENPDGEIIFTQEEIVNLSRQVRLT
jgi:hypothetical protein